MLGWLLNMAADEMHNTYAEEVNLPRLDVQTTRQQPIVIAECGCDIQCTTLIYSA
jgi:hypothetical protein